MEELIVINKGFNTLPENPNLIQQTLYFFTFEDEQKNKYVWSTTSFRPEFTAIANRDAKIKIRFKRKPQSPSIKNPEFISITNVTLKEVIEYKNFSGV